MTKKIKPQPPGLVIDSFEKLDEAVSVIANNQREIDRITLTLQTSIDKQKEKAGATVNALQKRIDELALAVAIYAQDNREELLKGKSKSRELTLGVIGWRIVPSLKTLARHTWKKVLANVKELQASEEFKTLELADAIKVKEQLDKNALHKWPKEQLGSGLIKVI